MRNGCCCSQPVWLEYIKLTLATAGVGEQQHSPKAGLIQILEQAWGKPWSWLSRWVFYYLRETNLLVCIKYNSGSWMREADFFVVAFSKRKRIFTHTNTHFSIWPTSYLPQRLLIHLSRKAASASPSPGLHEELTAALNICPVCGWTCWVLPRTTFSWRLQQGLSVFQAGSSTENLQRNSFLFIP